MMMMMVLIMLMMMMSAGKVTSEGFYLSSLDDFIQEAHLTQVRDEGLKIVCKDDNIDIAFVIDASRSIYGPDYEKEVNFVHNLVSIFNIKPEKIHVAALMYGEHVDRETAFGLTRYTTKEDVLMAIKTLVNRDRYLMGHSTETGRAIAYARNYLFKNARPGASKICVVLTDGFSQNFDLTAEEASNARKDGIEMIAIGIGKEVSMKEVEAIASRPDLVFKIDSFDLLPRFQTSVMTKTCKKMYKIVNGTENKFPPGDGGDEDKCKDRQIDLNIVFRPSTVPPPYIVDLIDESISSDDMVGGVTKVGVITIPSVNINGFRLNNYENKAEIKQHFGRQDPGFILTPSLQDLRTEAFETRNGGRPDSRKVGLLIIDEKIRDIEQAVNETELARADGIDIFCMDIGASNSIGLLQGLTGGAEDSVVSVGTLLDIPPIGNLLIGKICMNTTRTD